MRNFLLICFIALYASAMGTVNADFGASTYAGCPPLAVSFSDSSSTSSGTIKAWFWNFSNGNTSTFQSPSATFLTSGKYTVTLVVTDASGSTDSISKIITVFVLPTVNFSAINPTACLGAVVNFVSNVTPGSAPITGYAWGFGNGKASNAQNAAYQYPQTGTYDITLVVQDSNGCTANKTINSYVTINAGPQAAFTASPASSCNATQTVSFTNNSTGSALTYNWTLDNGVNSILKNPTYTYTQESYNVTLVVTDSTGCQSTASQKVTAMELVAGFAVSNPSPCTGQPVQFNNTSNFPGTSWAWNFGDGSTSNSNNPIHAYNDTGTYSVSFVIKDGVCGDSITHVDIIHVITGFAVNKPSISADSTLACGGPLTVNFSNTTPGVNGNQYQYHWDFGNGDTSDLQNPAESYTASGNFNITFSITDSSGCTIIAQVPGFIKNSPPVPAIIVDPNTCPGMPRQFTNISLNATSYLWQFGDGDTSTAVNPSHTYNTTGAFTVTLTAFGPNGCDSTKVFDSLMQVGIVSANFTVKDSFSPCPPFVTTFSNLSSPGATNFSWDFGDGYTDTAANPTHIYFHPGVFTVTLTSRNFWGFCTDTLSKVNLITVQGPIGNFSITPTSGCAPLNVNITSTMDSDVKTHICDLGDGTVIDDSLAFSHVYTTARSYYPQFILTDYTGCTVSYTLDTITVHGPSTFQLSDTSVCPGMPVRASISADSSSYFWQPAAYVSCDTCKSVIINAPGNITLTATAINQWGCNATDSMNITIVPLPVLNDSISVNLCKGDQMTLSAANGNYHCIWLPPQYLSDSSIANPVCAPLSSITYNVTAFNQLGCASQTTIAVNVKDKVEVALPADTVACTNSSIQLNATLLFSSALGAQYSWSPAEYLNNPDIPDPSATVGDNTVKLTLVVASGHCTPDTQSINITAIPLPDIEVSQNVTATPGAEVPLYAASHQELSYEWTAKDSLSCADCRRTDVFPNSSQVVYVRGVNSHGCAVTDSVNIDVEGCDGKSIYMPNTFTPNGDGVNDKFYVRTTALSSLKFFRIFDEWGQMVFETNNLSEGWDGNANGKPGATAVYVYVLEGQCQNGYEVYKTGNVTAIR